MDMLVVDGVFIYDHGVFEGRLDGDDARLKDRLLIFCVVILAVLGKVAVRTCYLDLFRYFFSFFAF